MVAFNSAQRRNVPVWSAGTMAYQIVFSAAGGAATTIDLSSGDTIANGGVGSKELVLRSGYVMICNQGTGNLTIQNKHNQSGVAPQVHPNHGLTLVGGATFEFAVGKMQNPEGNLNSILVKGAPGDTFSVFYFED
jgi:hypothetical protein